jgi:hypothetical protein
MKTNTIESNPVDRNPDVNLETETIPPGMQLLEGKRLMMQARIMGIPYGVAYTVRKKGRSHNRETHGLILRDADVPTMVERVAGLDERRRWKGRDA